MGDMVELETSDGVRIGAYKAVPGLAPTGGIVVIQEAFGVNHHIRAVADRFAVAGYDVLAPALYDRVERDVQLGYRDEHLKRGMSLARRISMEQHVLSAEAAIDALAESGPVAIVGFCLGGTVSYATAAKSGKLAAAVGYYGGGIAGMIDAKPRCPVILHFGEKDQHIPASDVDKIKAAQPDVPVYTYPADHGFNCDDRSAYDKPSADLAWSRTIAFLERDVLRLKHIRRWRDTDRILLV